MIEAAQATVIQSEGELSIQCLRRARIATTKASANPVRGATETDSGAAVEAGPHQEELGGKIAGLRTAVRIPF